MAGGKTAIDETEVYKRKLQALEGDKVALTERLNATVTANQTAISTLREENKDLERRLRQLKNQPKAKHGAGLGPKAIEMLDQKVCNAIKKHNAVRAQAEAKELELAKLQEEMLTLTVEENHLNAYKDGISPEGARIRELENELQKSIDKYGDASYITKTYEKIIDKLNQDRLQFDNTLLELEDTANQNLGEIAQLQSLCADAESARDTTKQELAEMDRVATIDREQREKEKKELLGLAEEQQRKFEALERMSKSSHGDANARSTGEGNADGVADKLQTSEVMMRRIQEATGVMDVHEVMERFKSQKETEAKLSALKEENSATLSELKEQLKSLQKSFNSLKYSGEARNTSNQRVVTEFEKYLNDAKNAIQTHEQSLQRSQTLLVDIGTGVDHLHDKVETRKAVQFRAATNTADKLLESKLRLEQLIEELEQRKGEMDTSDEEVPMILPENNVRIKFAAAPGANKAPDDDDDLNADNEAVSRDQIKRQSQLIVEKNAVLPGQQGKGKGGKRR